MVQTYEKLSQIPLDKEMRNGSRSMNNNIDDSK